MGFIYFYINLNLPGMRRLFILLFAFVAVIACNNNNKMNAGNDTGGQNDDKALKDNRDDANDVEVDRKADKNIDKSSQYTWKKAEQNKFMEDCSRDSEENVDKGKLKDFCSCMLTQAQKYYPSYDQMYEKSNEDDDREILAKCIGSYGRDGE
jgi:hypothetical protein